MKMNFYDLEARNIKGEIIKMSEYKDKVVIVVNTASKCGLTPQYEKLEKLYEKYKDKGLVILGFPCDQFAHQEPGTNKEIAEFCQVNYGVTFPMFEKVDVNGDNAHPIFVYLKSQVGGLFSKKIRWNFTKFLINRQGQPYKRLPPLSNPAKIEKYFVQLLEDKKCCE